MLYTDDGCAVLKHWTGDNFGKEEIVATNVRAGSTASYIPTPDGGLLVYITDSSTVAITQFDEDEEDWVEDSKLPQCAVHPDGQLVAALGAGGSIFVIFQSDEGRLIYLQEPDDEQGAWAVTEIEDAHKPALGTPLSIRINPTSLALNVFYISSDNAVHCIKKEEDDVWADAFTISGAHGTCLKRMFVAKRSEQIGDTVYALTYGGSLLQLAADQGPVNLGRVEKEGCFMPNTTAECCVHIFGLQIAVDIYLSVGFGTKKRRGRFF